MATKESENNYRSERKERLAKNAKKRSNKSHDSSRLVRVIVSVVGVVLALAIVFGVLWAYGVPQSVLPAEKVGDRTYTAADFGYYYMTVFQTNANQSYQTMQQLGISLGFDYTKSPNDQTTTDADGNTITYAEKFRNDTRTQLEQNNYYLKLAKEQGLTLSDDSLKEIENTISEYASTAETNGYSTNRYVSLMFGKGVTLKKFRGYLEEQYLIQQYLDQEEKRISDEITDAEIDAEYEKNPTDYQQVDVRLFALKIQAEDAAESETAAAVEETTAAETETAAAAEETTAAEVATEAATEAETEAATEAATEETTAAPAAETAPSAQETLIKEMYERITDEQSFIDLAKEYCAEEDKATYEDDTATLLLGTNKSAVANNIDKDFAEWLFSADRKAGDKNTVTTSDTAYVVYILKPAYRNEVPLVSVRHILIGYDNIASDLGETKGAEGLKIETKKAEDGTEITNEGTGYSIDVAMQTYEKALSVLNEYNAGEQTEDKFAELAETYSNDTGSVGENAQTSGGLYENVQKGQMVAEFDNWIYDESRTAGEVGMVKTRFGWHIIYFVSKQDEPAYKTSIRNSLMTGKAEEISKAAEEASKNTAVPNAMGENFAMKQAVKQIEKLYVNHDHDHAEA